MINNLGFENIFNGSTYVYLLLECDQILQPRKRPCFLDASKTFDKIKHYTLFQKLLYRKTPIMLVRVLLFWYTKQTMCVKWGNCTSDYFYDLTGLDKEEFYLRNCIQC